MAGSVDTVEQGLDRELKFSRVLIPTVGLPWYRRHLNNLKRPKFRLLEDYHVTLPEGDVVILPKGFVSDGGSVPHLAFLLAIPFAIPFGLVPALIVSVLAILAFMINPVGVMLVPFLVHDFAYRYKVLLRVNRSPLRVDTAWQANNIMRRVNFMVNDMVDLGLIAHVGVATFGWIFWRAHRKNDASGINSISPYFQEADSWPKA